MLLRNFGVGRDELRLVLAPDSGREELVPTTDSGRGEARPYRPGQGQGEVLPYQIASNGRRRLRHNFVRIVTF
jgi:hypothetical protein